MSFEDREFSVLARTLERQLGLPIGALEQGRITALASNANRAVWTQDGGVVMCSDGGLAEALVRVIEAGPRDEPTRLLFQLQEETQVRIPGFTGELYLLLHCVPSLGTTWPRDHEVIEMLGPGQEGLPELSDETEHVFAIRRGSVVAAYAWNIPQLEVGGRSFSAVGAQTHRDYRGKGLGKTVVSVLLQHLASEGGIALWSCEVSNAPSLRLARSVGFVGHMWVFSWRAMEPHNGAAAERRPYEGPSETR